MSGELAARQAALVAALVDGAADPAGMDSTRLSAARRALLRKRSGLAAREWPLVAAGMGAGWTPLAVEVLAGLPVADGLRDGWVIARVARERGLLTDGARRELGERERRYRFDGVRSPRPRLFHRLLGR